MPNLLASSVTEKLISHHSYAICLTENAQKLEKKISRQLSSIFTALAEIF